MSTVSGKSCTNEQKVNYSSLFCEFGPGANLQKKTPHLNCVSVHTFSVALIFVHIPLTSFSPAINTLHVRLDPRKVFSWFMEKSKNGGGKYR